MDKEVLLEGPLQIILKIDGAEYFVPSFLYATYCIFI